MVNFKVLKLEDKNKWKVFLQRLPPEQQDIYYTPEYYSLYENYGDGEAMCFVFEKDGDIALYPFLINSVNSLGYDLDKEYYDIQGAYGYNGVVTSSYEPNFIKEFYNEFNSFCSQKSIIAEFSRFHPILNNESFVQSYMSIIPEMDNVILNLEDDNIYFNSYEYSTRKNIKKAEKNNLIVEQYIGKDIKKYMINEFETIYRDTMKRNNADKYYLFNSSFFENIFKKLPNSVMLSFTKYKNQYISSEITPFSNYIAYSFLGGTYSDYFHLRPNDLLKHNIIIKLKELGLKYFCLGGGSEGIVKFKKSFSKNGISKFYIGKKIHNPDIYNKVIRNWEMKYPEKTEKYKNYLLKYRY